jgi:uncharacterized protein (TIGR03083 family)
MLTPAEYHAAIERDANAVTDILRSADLEAAVPACPGWTVGDLGRHLGAVHRWALEAVQTGRSGEEQSGPRQREALVAWFEQGAAALVDGLSTADPESPTWTFGPPPRRVSFWSRRQAHETSIHLVDAQQAVGVHGRLDPLLAADGVDEVVTVFFPRQVRLNRIPPLTHGVRVVLTDGSRATLSLAGDGTDPSAPTHATIRGPAEAVLLALWGRADIGDLAIDGDPDVVRAVLWAGITP